MIGRQRAAQDRAEPGSAESAGTKALRGENARNFRLYFLGQAMSMGGTWMRTLALSWLALDKSGDSGVAVGIVVALQYLPLTLLGTWVGVLADRLDKRRMLMYSQMVGAAGTAGLSVVALADLDTLLPVYALVLVVGISQAFDFPVRQALLPEIVEPEALPNAIGLISAVSQVSRVLGPLVGGAIIATLGTATCFFINSLTYVVLIAALSLMDPQKMLSSKPVTKGKGQIRAGLRYMWRTPTLRGCLVVMLLVGLFAVNNQVLLPLVAKESFDGGAGMYSVMIAAMGAGAFVGSFIIASRTAVTGRFFVACGLTFGVSMTVAALAPTVEVFVALLIVYGMCQTTMLGSGQVLVQLSTDGDMRGRVMSVWMMGLVGTAPLGGPMMGGVASAVNPLFAYGLGGVISIVAFLAFAPSLGRVQAVARAPDQSSARFESTIDEQAAG